MLTCIRELPYAEHLLMSFYECRYADFFAALSTMSPCRFVVSSHLTLNDLSQLKSTHTSCETGS